MARKIQYDTFITVYFSDCDYYSRVMREEWKLVSYTEYCPGLDLKVKSFLVELFPALPSCIAILMQDCVLQQGTSPQTLSAIAALRPTVAVGTCGTIWSCLLKCGFCADV